MNTKTKLSVILLNIGIIFFSSPNSAQAQKDSSDKQVVAMLKDFYTSYMTAFSDGADENKFAAIQKKYCTAALLKRVPKLAEQWDSDPFLKAQDSNVEYLKTLTVKKDLKKRDSYIVSYYAVRTFVIHLLVIKQNESYKIDSVW